jgi:hypothetical protein
MFEQKRLCGDGAYTTWADQFRERDEQMDGEDEAPSASPAAIAAYTASRPRRDR